MALSHLPYHHRTKSPTHLQERLAARLEDAAGPRRLQQGAQAIARGAGCLVGGIGTDACTRAIQAAEQAGLASTRPLPPLPPARAPAPVTPAATAARTSSTVSPTMATRAGTMSAAASASAAEPPPRRRA